MSYANPNSDLLKFALTSLFIALVCGWVMFVTQGCGYAKHIDPPTYRFDNAKLAELSARAHVKDRPGLQLHQNVCCGSMKPLIQQGDWIVTEKTPFGDRLLGRVCVYRPKWRNYQPVLHRFVAGDAKSGFIPSGDNNARSEATERITADLYESEVIAIYRYAHGS